MNPCVHFYFTSLNKILFLGKKDKLSKCGCFGDILKKQTIAGYLRSSNECLELFCKVSINLPKKLSNNEFSTNQYAAPAIYLPPFNREIRIDAFKHTWIFKNYEKWFEKEKQEFVVYSDIFYQAKEYSDVYFLKEDKKIQLAMALSCQIVTVNNINCENSNTDNNTQEISVEKKLKKQKFTLYLYPFTLDDTEVQFILHILYKIDDEKWKKSKQ